MDYVYSLPLPHDTDHSMSAVKWNNSYCSLGDRQRRHPGALTILHNHTMTTQHQEFVLQHLVSGLFDVADP